MGRTHGPGPSRSMELQPAPCPGFFCHRGSTEYSHRLYCHYAGVLTQACQGPRSYASEQLQGEESVEGH